MMDYKTLKTLVIHHCHLYYDEGKPTLSDSEFDSLYEQLEHMESEQGWKDADSPTSSIPATGKVAHRYPLYSLKKVYEPSEVDSSFTIRLPKLDGVNLSLDYVDGSLSTALTRGNGKVGENVTQIVPYIKGISPELNESVNCVIVGEVLTDMDVTNPRNFVAGSLGLNNPAEAADRGLVFIVHDVLGIEMDFIPRMKLASSLGFSTVMDDDWAQYPQDGIVFRTASRATEKDLGYTAKHPRFAVALKQKESFSTTTHLKAIEWAVGRSGVVTPVGIVDPVILDDAKVSRVILHNIEFVEQHRLGQGDLIMIERRITPQFVRVLKHSEYPRFTQVDAETSLGQAVTRSGPRLYVEQEEGHRLVEHFVKTLGIKGLGPANIKKMGFLHPAELFDDVDWSKLGKVSIGILEELHRPKPYPLVLAAMGIPGVGKSTAELISSKLPSFSDLKRIDEVDIPRIGPITKQKVSAWLELNEGWASKLPYALSTTPTVKTGAKKICISGKLDKTKGEIAAILEPLGFVLHDSVTKDCYTLISGGDESTKVRQALKFNIPVINYWKHRDQVLTGSF